MNFNFYEWIRAAVKRAVLMGVTDAVETLGMPPDDESSKDKILSFLQSDEPQKIAPAPATRRLSGGSSGNSNRKLGRSIAEIHPE